MKRTHRDAPLNVAVVEHRELVRMGIVSALQECDGYKVVLAVASGGELLTACREGAQLDVVLLELELPVMDGFAVLARLRERHGTVRVLAMALEPARELVTRAMRQQACTVLCTGTSAEALCKALRDVALTGQHLSAPLRYLLEAGWRPRDATKEEEDPAPRCTPKLSPRELEYWKLHCTMKNSTVARVAERMGVGYHSARTYRRRLCEKLGVCGSQELFQAGLKAGIVPLEGL